MNMHMFPLNSIFELVVVVNIMDNPGITKEGLIREVTDDMKKVFPMGMSNSGTTSLTIDNLKFTNIIRKINNGYEVTPYGKQQLSNLSFFLNQLVVKLKGM